MTSFLCSRCGQTHSGIPTIGFKFPIEYLDVPEAEREERLFLTEYTCVIDDDRFLRPSGRWSSPIVSQTRDMQGARRCPKSPRSMNQRFS